MVKEKKEDLLLVPSLEPSSVSSSSSVVLPGASATRNSASRIRKLLRKVVRLIRLSTNKRSRAKTLTRDTPKSPSCQPSKLLTSKLEIEIKPKIDKAFI